MASIDVFTAAGRVGALLDGGVVFKPARTTYELHFRTARRYDGPIDEPIDAMLSATARKIYSIPSGGSFVSPIFGPPRIIQGRVVHIEEGRLVVRAGVPFVVQIPAAKSAIDLNNGVISVGSLVNIVALPGASFERAPSERTTVAATAQGEVGQSPTRSIR